MTDPTAAVTGRWLHSIEEDHGDVTVHRPRDHDVLPARGRQGIEFSVGSFTERVIGRGDAPQVVPGPWRTAAADRFEVTTERTGDRVLEVVHRNPERLEVRWRSTS